MIMKTWLYPGTEDAGGVRVGAVTGVLSVSERCSA
jgi:hypothetical protein